MRRISGHFRSGFEAMIREAEMEEMEKKWRDQNEKIMRHNPPTAEETDPTGAYPASPPAAAEEQPAPATDGTDQTPAPAAIPPASAESKAVADPVVNEDR